MKPLDTKALAAELDRDGFARIDKLIDDETCATLVQSYDDDEMFRSTVTMARHGFGRGEYRYFAYPLPESIQRLRSELYPLLATIANSWEERLKGTTVWPADHTSLLDRCALAGQSRPTPLLLRYGEGDHNRLHQDLYGPLAFPLQVVVLLAEPGRDFDGGELVLVEGRARMQSRPIVITLRQGDAAIIPVRHRPIASARGWTRATMRHGVATVRSGRRHTLGIIFHDAA